VTAGDVSRAEVCAVACADIWRGDGEIVASAFGTIPAIGARLAKLTFAPDLMLSDGQAYAVLDPWSADPVVETWLPFRTIFDVLSSGRRHVMMLATQLGRWGDQNISAVGDWAKPTRQLLGVRGAPGNTVNHTTSYWIPRHSTRVFTEPVDMVSGVGYRRAAEAGPAATRFHELRRVVTDLAVLDFETPDHAMRLRSVHPGVSVGQVLEATGYPLALPDEVPQSRLPSAEELRLIREMLDPKMLRDREIRT
jgi:acyl CoA:acetate/3-ketoacid CoA transferase beta subunit